MARTQDPWNQQAKQLNSRVKQLRSWVLSDPAKAADLADGLNDVTSQLNSGHAWS